MTYVNNGNLRNVPEPNLSIYMKYNILARTGALGTGL